MIHDQSRLNDLKAMALALEWGSDDQIWAQTEWFDAMLPRLTADQRRAFERYSLKATTPEMFEFVENQLN